MAIAAASIDHCGEVCRHCGENCVGEVVRGADGPFCCSGCAAVFAVIKEHDLDSFYACDLPPGVTQKSASAQATERFAALDDPTIAARLLDYADGNRARVTLAVPGIHCGSCVWLLEQLWRFDAGVARSEVDLGRRSVRVEFDPAVTSLRRDRRTACSIGYEPAIVSEAAPQDRCGDTPPVPATGCGRLRVRQHHAVQHPALRQRRGNRAADCSGCSTS